MMYHKRGGGVILRISRGLSVPNLFNCGIGFGPKPTGIFVVLCIPLQIITSKSNVADIKYCVIKSKDV